MQRENEPRSAPEGPIRGTQRQLLAGPSDRRASKVAPGTDSLELSALSARKSLYFVRGDPCPGPRTALHACSCFAWEAGSGRGVGVDCSYLCIGSG